MSSLHIRIQTASAISTRPLAIAKRSQCLEVRRQPNQVKGDQGAQLQPLVLRRSPALSWPTSILKSAA
jgi:hypothetical protein